MQRLPTRSPNLHALLVAQQEGLHPRISFSPFPDLRYLPQLVEAKVKGRVKLAATPEFTVAVSRTRSLLLLLS